MKILGFVVVFICSVCNLLAQELFPHNEPASSIPKGVFGARAFVESFQERNVWRNMGAIRLMYGLTPKLSVMATGTSSNHHGKKLPQDLVTHIHIGSQTIYYTNAIQKGVPYDYRINGINLYAKYRFLTIDGQNKHLRAAAYAEYAYITSAHDEAEPNLTDDNKGYGGGLIVTWLKNRFAASVTTGVIIPGSYSETQYTPSLSIPSTHIELFYGRAIKCNLSLGYLVSPKEYRDYNQTNWNVYFEFQGKTWESAKVLQDGVSIDIQTPALKSGYYVEVHPCIQKIIDSNLRIDFSVGFPLINKSYVHFYPLYLIGIQRYFYPRVKRSVPN